MFDAIDNLVTTHSPRPISELEKSARASGLRDPGSLELFMIWHALGGPKNPPTFMELAGWDPELLADFTYLLEVYYYRLKVQHRKDEISALAKAGVIDGRQGNT